jgi:hypothetical protein
MFFPAADTIAFSEGGVESMRLDSSGRLGIGTTSPSQLLDVQSAGTYAANIQGTSTAAAFSSATFWDGLGGGLQIRNAATTTNAPTVIGFRQAGVAASVAGIAAVFPSSTQSELVFCTNNGGSSVPERMRISSAGVVSMGIGAFGTTPATTGVIRIPNASPIFARNAGNDADRHIIAFNSSGQVAIAGDGNDTIIGTSVGTVKTPTTISVGAATPASTGAGITFPATQSASSNANTLDDYEEGTYTPIVSDGFTSPGYSTQVGRYTKIGRVCYFSVYITVISGTRTAGVFSISLPFLAGNTGGFGGGGAFNYVNAGVIDSVTVNLPTIYIGSENGNLNFYKTNGGSFTGNDCNTATPQVYLSGWYEVF